MSYNILLCGVGGQGTVLASKLLAAAAEKKGEIVHSAETIGMAQRGGPVTSHVRIGKDAYVIRNIGRSDPDDSRNFNLNTISREMIHPDQSINKLT